MDACPYCCSKNLWEYYRNNLPLWMWPVEKSKAGDNICAPVRAVLCRDCWYGFNTEPPGDELLKKIYDNYTFTAPSKGIGASVFENVKNVILQHVPLDAHIFEIGASDGYILRFLWDNGYRNLRGIDPAPRVGDDFPVELRRGYFNRDTQCGRVDVFILVHVLEHLESPWEMMKLMRDKLAEDGRILIEVPQADGALTHQHLSYFTPGFLRRMGEDCGLYFHDARFFQNVSILLYGKTPSPFDIREAFEPHADTLERLKAVSARRERMIRDMEAFLAQCAGEPVYWWGTGAAGTVGFQSLGRERFQDVRLVVVDGDRIREGLLFTPSGQEVCYAETLLRNETGVNIIFASALYLELFKTLERIGCIPKRVFYRECEHWV